MAAPPAVSNESTMVAEWVIVGICLLFVLLRLWVRGYLQGRLALSDFLVVLGWVSFVAASIVDILLWKWGAWDQDFNFGGTEDIDFHAMFPDEAVQLRVMKLFYLALLPWMLTLYCVKASFLLFYLQLFPPMLKRLRQALYFTIGFTFLGFVVSVFMNLFWCFPIKSNWALKQSEQCLSFVALPPYFVSVAFHFLSDIMIYALPFFLLKHLMLSRRKILGLVLVFSLGGLAIACTIMRIVVIGDSTRLTSVALWGSFEQGAGIVIACCPPLKWLLRRKSISPSTTPGAGSENRGRSKRSAATLITTLRDPNDGYDLGVVDRAGEGESIRLDSVEGDAVTPAESLRPAEGGLGYRIMSTDGILNTRYKGDLNV